MLDTAISFTVGSSSDATSPVLELGDRPFAEVLRTSRLRAGLTQKALADLSTISPRAIRDIEAGRANARVQTILLLADGMRLHGLMRELFIHAGLGGRPADALGGDAALSVPTPVSAILGRDTEVRAMMDVLESGRRRMISMSGLPGVGKTRVATEVAARLGSRRGWPVVWVGMTSQDHNARGTALGPLRRSLRMLIESDTQDVSPICKLVGQHEVLLVLDGIADLKPPTGVEELLAYCPGVRVISTSRTPWHIPGVQPTVIPPLPVPGPECGTGLSSDTLAGIPSVRLLVERLSEVMPGFRLSPADTVAAAELCRKLDGLPLAVEAVAGLFRVFGLHQLARASVTDLLEITVPVRSAGEPATLGELIGSRMAHLSDQQQLVLHALARCDSQRSVLELARALNRPLNEVVDDLSLLIGCGLLQVPHGEPATDLRMPNLVRALLNRPEPASG